MTYIADEMVHPEITQNFIGNIPIRNLWLLMFYASSLFKQVNNLQRRTIEENPENLADLVAEMLIQKVQEKINRNLTTGYQTNNEILSRVRGKIDFINTERKNLINKGKIYCKFDKISTNTPRNRYIRAALEKLTLLLKKKNLTHRCKTLANTFYNLGVVGDKPTGIELSKDTFGRNDAKDIPIVELCRLVFNLALPTELSGGKYFHDPSRNIEWVRKLYEQAVAGFYSVVATEWIVEPGKFIYWPFESQTQLIEKIFPSMKTDMILTHRNNKKKIIIDTKFNSLLVKGYHRSESLRSSYLYQMYTYIRSQENSENCESFTTIGMLMHPTIDVEYDESVIIQGHEIRFVTLNLNTDTKYIRKQLLSFLDNYA